MAPVRILPAPDGAILRRAASQQSISPAIPRQGGGHAFRIPRRRSSTITQGGIYYDGEYQDELALRAAREGRFDLDCR